MSRGSGPSRKSTAMDSGTLPLWDLPQPGSAAGAATPPGDARRFDPPASGVEAEAFAPQPPSRMVDGASREASQTWLAQGFADHLAAWALREGAPSRSLVGLRKAGYAVSIATSSGHACIELGAIADAGLDADAMRDALLRSKLVGTADQPGTFPLVLDAEDRLYLHRYFDYERRIAQRLASRRQHGLGRPDEQRLASRLSELFAGNAKLLGNESDWQKLAAALAVLNDLTVISGGPGTGKTTTVVNLLACLLELEPHCRIALAAPTGKAAARMQDAIRQRAAHWPPEVQARLPSESFTIHRLLGVQPARNEFRHDANNPLAIDVLVVDEASMLDLALAAKLFDAVPDGARIILLGDKDQLAAVESGAVFSELSADPTLGNECIARLANLCGIPAAQLVPPAPATPTPLHDTVVWLTHNFRFAADSAIGRLASDIKAGDAQGALHDLDAAEHGSLTWIDDAEHPLRPGTLARLRQGYAPYLDALRAGARDREAIVDAFERFRILCAERESPRGVRHVNELIARECRHATEDAWPSAGRSPWYVGRPVMVLRNDYVLKLYNGDIGIALPDATGNLMVHFRATDGSFREIAPLRLPEHETAFATTVHKAQGSEFDEVALVLPARESRGVTRELVYTAVTRARSRVILVSSPEVLHAAIRTPTVRHSGLIARLG